ATAGASNRSPLLGTLEGRGLAAHAYADGTYSIASPGMAGPVIRSDVEAVVDSMVLRSTAYPRHEVEPSGSTLTITHTGLAGKPDLVWILSLTRDQSWGEITVKVHNTTGHEISVQSIRGVHASSGPVVALGA